MDDMRERLTRLIDGFVFGTQIAVNNMAWDSAKVKELADFLIENGVIVLPCKVGDRVYFVYRNKIFEHKIREIVIGEYGGFAYSSDCFPFSSFGKYVFLTREEAERALKGV